MSNGIIPANPSITPAPKPAGQVVQIVSLPQSLQNNARAVRLEGEVVGQNKDGTTRIKTAEGNIDINIRGKQPQNGVKLDIEIPAGSPPRTATVRPAPPLPPAPITVDMDSFTPSTPRVQPQPSAPLPQTTQQSGGQNPTTTQTNAAQPTRLSQSYQAPTKPIPTQSTPQPLVEGQIVRLTPLPPAQAQAYIQQSMAQIAQTAITSQLVRVAFQSDLIAQNATDTLQKTLVETTGTIQSPKAGMPAQTTQTMPQQTPNTQNFSMIGKNDISQILSTPPPSQGATSTPIIQSILSGIKNSASPVTLFTNLFSGEEGNLIKNFISNLLPAPKSLPLDVKILDIKPPQNISLPNILSDKQKTNGLFSTIKQTLNPIATQQSSPSIVTGIVAGFTPQNLPIISIQWPSGTLSQNMALQFSSNNLQIGSQISFQSQTSIGSLTTTIRPVMQNPLMESSPFWPVMDDIFQTLSQTSPQLAQMFSKILPTPTNPSNMGASAMLFIASVRSGDISGWLGDRKIDALTKSGKDTLIKRLMQDAGNTVRANAETSSPEWRSYPMPMVWQNEISKVMLHIKHDKDADNKKDNEGSTRFIMDLSLTRMGDVQLDGLLRGKRLDLLVRTQMPISLSMQEAMKKAYADALTGTDIFGELGFQGDIKGWMNVLKREDKMVSSA